jgi:magnesium chelatase subunit H
VELLDDLFARAAAADEPEDMNFIKKHARQLESKGVTAGATSRLFSNPAGVWRLLGRAGGGGGEGTG